MLMMPPLRTRVLAPTAAAAALFGVGMGATGCIAQNSPAVAPAATAARPSSSSGGAPGPLTVLDWDGHRAAVSFTFDDAQPSHIAHYAELQAAGAPMTFYLNSGHPPEAGFDAAWTRAARDGHELGNHTTHHCHADGDARISGCIMGESLPDAGAEIEDNAAYITGHYPQSAVWTMASPFGDNGWIGPARSRVFINRGVAAGMIAPRDDTDPFNLPVHMAAPRETATSFNRFTDQARAGGKWLVFVFHTISPTTANWYNPVEVTEVVSGMRHALALDDVWVDTVANVGAYWRGQKLFASAKVSSTSPTGGNTTWNWALPPHFPPERHLRVTVSGGTLSQNGRPLGRGARGEYLVALDAGSLTWSR
jgi:Polysaccharide deacetylase